MKQYIRTFLTRGLMAAAGGPIILAVVYGILGCTGVVESLTPREVCTGILTVTVMAFIAAGITFIYTVEKLPIVSAALIHAGVLYLDYLIMYLLNDWIPRDLPGIGIFSLIFAVGYALVWLVIYLCTRSSTEKLNRKLNTKDKK